MAFAFFPRILLPSSLLALSTKSKRKSWAMCEFLCPWLSFCGAWEYSNFWAIINFKSPLYIVHHMQRITLDSLATKRNAIGYLKSLVIVHVNFVLSPLLTSLHHISSFVGKYVFSFNFLWSNQPLLLFFSSLFVRLFLCVLCLLCVEFLSATTIDCLPRRLKLNWMLWKPKRSVSERIASGKKSLRVCVKGFGRIAWWCFPSHLC